LIESWSLEKNSDHDWQGMDNAKQVLKGWYLLLIRESQILDQVRSQL
jgi:hypothetical protein